MRCFFDGKVKSQDTVLMNLYKRMFPKWTYQPRVRTPAPLIDFKPAKATKALAGRVPVDDIFGGRPSGGNVFVSRPSSLVSAATSEGEAGMEED